MAKVHEAKPFGRYYEPFVGGGTLFFGLCRAGKLLPPPAVLSDGNEELMNVYRCVKDNPDQLAALLQAHKDNHCREHYYRTRANVPATSTDRAARTIYLNRTCFNGVYRVNRKGQFNVPLGDYKNPRILDADNLLAASAALAGVELLTGDFADVLEQATSGDFVYCDPPYHPVSRTANLTAYGKNGFGEADQQRLADVVARLTRRGVKVLLSNSHTDLVLQLYREFRIEHVAARRAVNCKANRRGNVGEVLVSNF
jgi:DNA adenine methylase